MRGRNGQRWPRSCCWLESLADISINSYESRIERTTELLCRYASCKSLVIGVHVLWSADTSRSKEFILATDRRQNSSHRRKSRNETQERGKRVGLLGNGETDEENLPGSSRMSRPKVYAGRVGNTIRVNDLNEAECEEQRRYDASGVNWFRWGLHLCSLSAISRMQKFMYRTEGSRFCIERTLVRFIAR